MAKRQITTRTLTAKDTEIIIDYRDDAGRVHKTPRHFELVNTYMGNGIAVTPNQLKEFKALIEEALKCN